ncbi:phage baseplate assembly protein V [Pseudodesulfovibrio sp. JC047]|nr:phage baseplate assembly protein V [Pseudodesulfovibrio sp. JC047]
MRAVEKMLRPIRRRLALMVSRAVLVMIDDDTTLQELQTRILGEELLDSLERFQQYGFTSVPHPGAEAITLSVGGHRSHTVVINVDDRRYRLKGMKGGEVALYTDEGDYIHFQRGRIVKMKAGTEALFDTPLARFTGRVEAEKDILDQTGSGNSRTINGMRQVFNGHNHPGDSGGTTESPNQEQ